MYVNHWSDDNSVESGLLILMPDGTLSNMKTFGPRMDCDGMSMDELGNIYVSGGVGVNAYDPIWQ